ncbi:MAG: biotin--[acetyl-CoA-carboxylase] ligase [Pseudohongiella sp.]|jgi:BirA family transcriptional regulator, biotin operon repressor / biotin---[acetyl-CoA-carboxylase] ligase|nr:biotin--[acetyl-CoA-carboxylase] ligase [Pseudohongiella sp.]
MEMPVIQNLLSVESQRTLAEIQVFEEIDSTNAEAIRQIQSGNTANRLVIARSQSAGRGRRGRSWLSPLDAGIYMSLVRQFTLPPDALQGLSLLTALSLKSALNRLGVSGLKLKWPNDILFQKKKLAGILLELQHREQASYLVFGIGLNIALPEQVMQEIDRPVTDITSIADYIPDTNLIVATVINQLCSNIAEYERNGFSSFKESWNEADYYLNRDIVIQNGERRIIGKSLGVDSNGALLMQTATGVESINGGEVFPSLRELSD